MRPGKFGPSPSWWRWLHFGPQWPDGSLNSKNENLGKNEVLASPHGKFVGLGGKRAGSEAGRRALPGHLVVQALIWVLPPAAGALGRNPFTLSIALVYKNEDWIQ